MKSTVISQLWLRGAFKFDPDDRIFTGRVLAVEDIVGCHGSTVDELVNAFREAVDDYLIPMANPRPLRTGYDDVE